MPCQAAEARAVTGLVNKLQDDGHGPRHDHDRAGTPSPPSPPSPAESASLGSGVSAAAAAAHVAFNKHRQLMVAHKLPRDPRTGQYLELNECNTQGSGTVCRQFVWNRWPHRAHAA